VTSHWTDGYYGELYLDSVGDLLTPRLSELEAEVIAGLLAPEPRARVLDLACGHGRHAWAMAGRVGRVVGLERSAAYLRRATAGPPHPDPLPPLREGRGSLELEGASIPIFLRADVRHLPIRPASFDAAYSWYSSLFMFDDATNAACLAALATVVRRGGRVLVHHANPLALAMHPHDAARRTLADGSIVDEISRFDPATGVDRCTRRMTRPSGAVLEGTAELRYYNPFEWRALSQSAGLRLVQLTSTTDVASPRPELGPEAPDLIALLEKT
jgi:SAM-dependent methyltransferase